MTMTKLQAENIIHLDKMKTEIEKEIGEEYKTTIWCQIVQVAHAVRDAYIDMEKGGTLNANNTAPKT